MNLYSMGLLLVVQPHSLHRRKGEATVCRRSLIYNDALLDMWNMLPLGFSGILSNPFTCEPELPHSVPLQATMVPGSCNSIEGLWIDPNGPCKKGEYTWILVLLRQCLQLWQVRPLIYRSLYFPLRCSQSTVSLKPITLSGRRMSVPSEPALTNQGSRIRSGSLKDLGELQSGGLFCLLHSTHGRLCCRLTQTWCGESPEDAAPRP